MAAEAKAFFPFGDEWSLFAGASFASGRSPGARVAALCGAAVIDCPPTIIVGASRDNHLFGGDVYLKWKPANVSGGYLSLAFQAEAIFRQFEASSDLLSEWDEGFYAQLVVQVARRWLVGARYDWVRAPAERYRAETTRASASVTFQASEFARVRGYLEYERAEYVQPYRGPAAFLQLEISIGAHGAHPF